MLLLSAMLMTQAHAFEAADQLSFELSAGGQVEGWYLTHTAASVTVTSDNEVHLVPVALVEQATLNGEALGLEALRAELAVPVAVVASPEVLRTPAPLLVGVGSALWPGAGHAMLGDWGSFLGYTGVELVLIGGASYLVFVAENPAATIPIVAVDLVFRTYAVVESSTLANKRRSRLSFAPTRGGGALVWAGSF